MKCPKCKTVELRATKLEDGLPVMGCERCGGVSITLLYYRDWVERTAKQPEDETLSAQSFEEEVESSGAHACAKCGRLMTKFAISGATKHKLDLCSSCDEAWLDSGEWELLKALHLSRTIPTVLTDAWQRKVRDEIQQNRRRERFERIIGHEDMEKVEEVRLWLKDHKHRSEILFYLNAE